MEHALLDLTHVTSISKISSFFVVHMEQDCKLVAWKVSPKLDDNFKAICVIESLRNCQGTMSIPIDEDVASWLHQLKQKQKDIEHDELTKHQKVFAY